MRRDLCAAFVAGRLERASPARGKTAAKRLHEVFPIVNRGIFLRLVAGPSSSNIPLRWRKPALNLEET
jgi:hypothetical protein